MAGESFNPRDYGVDLDKGDFVDEMVCDFNDTLHGRWTIDDLLLHPREAVKFCDDVTAKRGY